MATLYEIADYGCVRDAKVFGLEESIRRAKYPLSTSIELDSNLTDGIKALAKSEKGSGHDQWLTGVIVQFDLTFTNKAFIEAERYHFFDFVSSQSTMHRILKFNLDEAFIEYTDKRMVAILKDKIAGYEQMCEILSSGRVTMSAKALADFERDRERKYLEILYSVPSGLKLTAGMTTNYRQLKTIYAQRKNHRLPEWREFCKWIETLPMSELITGQAEGGDSDAEQNQ